MNFAGCAFHAMGLETQSVQDYARRLIELSQQKELPIFRPYGLIYQGWAERVAELIRANWRDAPPDEAAGSRTDG